MVSNSDIRADRVEADDDLAVIESPPGRVAPSPEPRDLDRPPLAALLWDTPPGEFSPGLLEIVERPPAPIRPAVYAALVLMLITILAWGWFGRLAVYAEATGIIQAIGRSKVIEPQRAGQVAEIAARDGDQVKQGDVLARLDPTDALALQAQLADKLADIEAEIVRWPAELAAVRTDPIKTDAGIAWPSATPSTARVREQAVMRADLARLAASLGNLLAERRAREIEAVGLADSVAAQKALIATLSEFLAMVTQLEREGWNSHAHLLEIQAEMTRAEIGLSDLDRKLADARAAIPVIDSQIVAARESMTKTGEQRLASLQREAEDVTQKLAEATQTVAYMTLRAPVAGTVQASTLTTVGQVVKPGQQLMQVVPSDSTLEIAAYVPNTSIGLVREGQSVEIKVQTFLYTNYGTVPGTITRIGQNSLPLMQRDRVQSASLDGEVAATTSAQDTATLVFPITVTAQRTTMDIDGKNVPLTPGMAVVVDVLTERRRVLDYIISPLIELYSTAVHER